MTARAHRLSHLFAPLVNPAVFDFWAGHLNPAWSWDRPLARVVARRIEAQGTITLDLKANRHCPAIQAGQHINVSAEVQGRRVTRSYSPTRISRSGRRLSITVKQVDGGKLSQHLCRHARVGDSLGIGPAFGEMNLAALHDPAHADSPMLLLAAGSGITPLISLTRALDQAGLRHALTLVYWARTRAELCFAAELRALAARQPLFNVHFALTQEAQRLPGEHADRLNANLLATLVPDWAERRVLACGPAGFVDTARRLSAGTALSFMGEAFTPPPAAAVSDATGTVQITLALSGRSLVVPAGQALLPALEAQGVNLPSGCRMGICNTCSCPKQSGTTQHLHTGDREDVPTTALRLCVSRACTDLTLDL